MLLEGWACVSNAGQRWIYSILCNSAGFKIVAASFDYAAMMVTNSSEEIGYGCVLRRRRRAERQRYLFVTTQQVPDSKRSDA